MTAAVSSSETEQQPQPAGQGHKRLNLLAGFTRPSVLGGKKQAQQQRQASSNGQQLIHPVAVLTSAIPASSDASGQHKRAATSLGHHSRSRQDTAASNHSISYNNSNALHQPRQTSYDHARTSAFASGIDGGLGATTGGFAARHSNELPVRGANGQPSRTSSSLDGQYQQQLQLHHSADQRYKLHQDNPYAQHDKLAETLIQKLIVRLPHRTLENRLTNLYSDDDNGTKKIYSSLQQLSRHRLPYILHQLHSELEQVVKLPLRTDNQLAQYRQDPLDGLRSQAILLQMISGCLQWHWKNTAPNLDPPPLDDRTAKQLLGTVTFFLKQYYSPSLNANASTPFYDGNSLKSSGQTSIFPPPRNSESSTGLMTSVASPASFSGKFVHEHGTPASTSSPNAFTKRFRRTSHPTPASLSESQPSAPNFAPVLRTLQTEIHKREARLFSETVNKPSQQDIMKDCLISCASIVSYISASRWDVILTRIRSKLSVQWSAVASTSNGSMNQDELPEMSEIHLVEFSHFNDTRLTSILTELGISFSNLRKTAQPVISLILHEIIERYMNENSRRIFHSMYEDGKKLSFSGQPEIFFDIIFSVGDTIKKRNLTWPTLAILLPLCPEIVMQIAMGGGDTRSPMLSKKILFLDALRKAVRPPPSSDGNTSATAHSTLLGPETRLALLCYVEICKAASCGRPIQGRPLPPLWILADEMEVELRKRLLDPMRPCIVQDGSIDTHLTTNAIVAVARMSNEALQAEHVSRFLGLKVPTQLQLAGLKALQELCKTPITNDSAFKNTVFVPITKLLHQAVTFTFERNSKGQVTLHTISSRSKQIMDDLESDRNQIIIAILRFFLLDPELLLLQQANTPSFEADRSPLQGADSLVSFRPFDTPQIFGLLTCLMHEDNHPSIQETVVDLLLLLQLHMMPLHIPNELEGARKDATTANRRSFYAHIDVIALTVARPCLTVAGSVENDRSSNFLAYSRFVKQPAQAAREGARMLESADLALHLAELIGVSNLCSSDTTVKGLATTLVQAGAQLAMAIQTTLRSNLEGVAAAIDQDAGPVVGGHIAQMKRLMKIFRAVDQYTPSLPLVWLELYGHWKTFAAAFGMQGMEQMADKSVGGIDMSFMQVLTPNEDSMTEWIQLSGFLVRTAGLVYMPASGVHALNKIVPADYLPQWMEGSALQEEDVTNLLLGMLRLLSSEHPRMRDAAREQLGNELSPDLFHHVIAEIAALSDSFSDARQLEASFEAATLHFDQTLSILSQNIQRLSPPTSFSLFTCGYLERYLLAAASYAKQVGISANGTRIKLKVCKAAQAVLEKRKQCASSLSSSFRNKLAGYLLYFVEQAKHSDVPHKNQLELQGLQALVACFDGLCISRRPTKSTDKADMANKGMVQSYGDFLLDLLRYRELQQTEHTWNGHGSLDTRPLVKSDSADNASSQALRDTIVAAIANLLASNYPQSEGVIANLCKPSDACFETNLKILNATLPQLKSLSMPKSRDHFSDLVSIVAAPDLSLALSLVDMCTSADQEGIIELLMHILSPHGLETRLIKAVIEQEISTTDHESTLFRGNSAATRLLTTFARTRGYSYLRFLISNLLSSLAQQPLDLSDMDMYSESEEVDEGLLRLENLTEAFLSLICETSHLIPTEIQDICHHIQLVVRDFFPDSVYTAIGGWIFLRYINPAIISPEIVDLELPEDSRKALILIGKLLQALSNNIRFKEPGMKSLNGFIGKHILDMTTFLTQISSESAAHQPPLPASELRLSELEKEVLFEFIWQNSEHLGSLILARPAHTKSKHWQADLEEDASQDPSRSWKHLTKVLWNLKQESAMHKADSSEGRSMTVEALDLYKPAEDCFVPEKTLRAAFRGGFKSQRGNPAFCFTLRSLCTRNSDLPAVFLHAIRAMEAAQGTQFEILLDCTGYQGDNSIPIICLQLASTYAASSAATRLHSIYVFSPSSAFITYFKKVIAILPIVSFENKLHFVQATFELEDHFPSPSTVLHPSTLELLGLDRPLISEAILVCREGAHIRCQVRAGSKDLLITTSRKRTLYNEIKCETQDYLPFSAIQSARHRHGQYGASDFELHMKDGSIVALAEVDEPELLVKALADVHTLSNTGNVSLHPGAPASVATSTSTSTVLSAIIFALASNKDHVRLSGQDLWQQNQRLSDNTHKNDMSSLATSDEALPADPLAQAITHVLRLRLQSLPAALTEIFQDLPALPDAVTFKVLASIKVWVLQLAEPSNFEHSSGRESVYQAVQSLLRLSVLSKTASCFCQMKLWPTLLRNEPVVTIVLEQVSLAIGRIDLAEGQKSILKQIVGLSPSALTVRKNLIARLEDLVWKAASKESVAVDQTKEWEEIIGLVQLDAYMSSQNNSTSLFYVGDLLWLYCMIAGPGTEDDRRQIWLAIQSFLRSLDTPATVGDSHKTSLVKLEAAWVKLHEIQQVDVMEQLQDGYVPQVAMAIHSFIGDFIQACMSLAPSHDTRLYWSVRCANRALRCALSSTGMVQYRSLLVLSHFPIGQPAIRSLMQAVCVNLAENINSNALQAYMYCFISGLRQASDPILACQLFWLGIGASQAHPLLFASSALLVEAAVTCLVRELPSKNMGISTYLLQERGSTQELLAASEELDDSLEVHFTEENFSFAVASLFVKGLQQQDTAEHTITLFSTLAHISKPDLGGAGSYSLPVESHRKTTALPTCQNIGELGYITALLPSFARDPTETKEPVSSPRREDRRLQYQPILGQLDFDKNEPLVLAASLTMSLLYAATSQPQRVLLLQYMNEIAEISPAVVLLLSEELIPLLTAWLQEAQDSSTVDTIERLLVHLLSSPSNSRLNGLDISAYGAALGLPKLLDSASFFNFLNQAAQNTDMARQKLRCCADLLGAFLATTNN